MAGSPALSGARLPAGVFAFSAIQVIALLAALRLCATHRRRSISASNSCPRGVRCRAQANCDLQGSGG